MVFWFEAVQAVLTKYPVPFPALVFIRPLITKLQGDKPETMTNVNALVGKPALVTEEVTQVNGYVKIQGEIWSARTSNGSKAVDSEVVIEKIAGATLIVS